MTRTTIKVKHATVRFPRTRLTLGSIEKSLMSLLRIKTVKEDHFTALKDISLEIAEGEVVGIIGRNGSGKSTLLRIIAGIYRPDEGYAWSCGRISLLAGLGLGFNVNLTGRENIYLYGSILGHSKGTMDRLMDSIIDFSELNDFIDQPLRTYSSGMRARIGFAVASAVRPDILLIDEVLAVGDVEFKERSKKRIQEMVSEAGTVVIVSHSFGLLKQICDRMLLIDQGRLKATGDPAHVIDVYYNKAGPDAEASTAPT